MELVVAKHLLHFKFYGGVVERRKPEKVERNISIEYEQVNITFA